MYKIEQLCHLFLRISTSGHILGWQVFLYQEVKGGGIRTRVLHVMRHKDSQWVFLHLPVYLSASHPTGFHTDPFHTDDFLNAAQTTFGPFGNILIQCTLIAR